MHVSALALLKMAMHANSGGNIEVMGILQGKVVKETFIVIDVFALPVEGSETRVNAQAEAYEFMIDFMETCKVGGSVMRPRLHLPWQCPCAAGCGPCLLEAWREAATKL